MIYKGFRNIPNGGLTPWDFWSIFSVSYLAAFEIPQIHQGICQLWGYGPVEYSTNGPDVQIAAAGYYQYNNQHQSVMCAG